MNELQIFENPKFGNIRIITEGSKTLFCAKDVAAALGYKDTTNAIKQHCKGVVKRHLLTEGGNQLTNFIPEGDIYRLAAKSELPGAGEFESWIFDEVLPSIHNHGAYMTPETLEAAILNPDTMIKLCTALKEEQDKRKALEAENTALTAENEVQRQAIADLPRCLNMRWRGFFGDFMSFAEIYNELLNKTRAAAADALEHEVADEVRATMLIKTFDEVYSYDASPEAMESRRMEAGGLGDWDQIRAQVKEEGPSAALEVWNAAPFQDGRQHGVSLTHVVETGSRSFRQPYPRPFIAGTQAEAIASGRAYRALMDGLKRNGI